MRQESQQLGTDALEIVGRAFDSFRFLDTKANLRNVVLKWR
jgi:hypothetical protein